MLCIPPDENDILLKSRLELPLGCGNVYFPKAGKIGCHHRCVPIGSPPEARKALCVLNAA